MSDIVERLREAPLKHWQEAADEIDRLAREVEWRQAELQGLRAENERLQAEVDEWRERWAAERRDHEATIRDFDKLMNEGT